jgi:hypothetical protein
MADFTSSLTAQTGSFSSQFQFVQPDPNWFRPKPKQPTPQELAAALAPEVVAEEKVAAIPQSVEGNRMVDEYIARLQMNPAANSMPGLPGYNQQHAYANWMAGHNQPDQPLPHPDYKGTGYGEQLRMEAARAQADENLRSASRI